jgi:hypothetical protein
MTDWGSYAFMLLFYAVFLLPVALVLWLLTKYLRRTSLPGRYRATIFAGVSAIAACPVVVPAGTISVAFVPFSVALGFSRNVGDLLWFGKLWQINLAGLVISTVASALLAKWLFSNSTAESDARRRSARGSL